MVEARVKVRSLKDFAVAELQNDTPKMTLVLL